MGPSSRRPHLPSAPMTTAPVSTPLLELHGISKSFGSVQALTRCRVRGPAGRGDGPRRRQRRRQVDPDQVRRRHRTRRTAARSSSTATPVHIHGPKDAAKLGIEVVYQDLALCDNLDVVQNMYLGREAHDCFQRLKEPVMEAKTAETMKSLAVTTIPLDPPAGGDALGRPAAVGRRRPRGDVELAARDPRRADRGARRRADAAGARARRAAGRPGARRRADLAQPARHLRGRGPDHGAAARPQHRRLRARARRRSRRSSRRSPPASRRRCPASRRPIRRPREHRRDRRRPAGGRARRASSDACSTTFAAATSAAGR